MTKKPFSKYSALNNFLPTQTELPSDLSQPSDQISASAMSAPADMTTHSSGTTFKSSVNNVTQVETLVVPQAARPKSGGLKPRRKQASPINVRLNESEKEVVQKKARQAEMSVHAFMRYQILGPDYDPHLRKLFLSLNRELTAQGRNFNQIAKHMNNGGGSVEATGMLDAIRVPLIRALLAIKEALARGMPQP